MLNIYCVCVFYIKVADILEIIVINVVLDPFKQNKKKNSCYFPTFLKKSEKQ